MKKARRRVNRSPLIPLQRTGSAHQVCLQSCVCQRETRCHPPALFSVRVSLVQHAFVPAGGVESAPVKTIGNSTALTGKLRGTGKMARLRASGVERVKHKPSRPTSVCGGEREAQPAQVSARDMRCAQRRRQRLFALIGLFPAGSE